MIEPTLRRYTLPNGLDVAYQVKAELLQFYDDIFEKRVYTSHGIRLRDGDCVFDVGANIGLFSVFVAHHHPGVRIFSFEPAPPLFEILRANTAGFGGRVRLFNCGLSNRADTATLTFYPLSSGMSSFYPDEQQEKAALRTLIRGELARGRSEIEQLLQYEEELVEQRFRQETWTCRLRTLSDVLREQGVERIDLLKVDVEKSEADVFAGLADEDWPKIGQIVAEVHDLGDRLRELPEMLRSRGFSVELEQDELYRGSDRWNLYAVRQTAVARRSVPVSAAGTSAAPAPEARPEGIAIVGMSGRFPGAADLDEFWRNLCNGADTITFYSRAELEAAGVAPALLDNPQYVPARGTMRGAELFDAGFFGFAPHEAELMDPQHRTFLECAWEALENAGYHAGAYAGTIGVFSGMGMSNYLVINLLSHPDVIAAAGPVQTRILNDKDFLASQVAFKLGLTGPSVNIQTACSTSLVATCLACQSLLAYQCDMALAGGVSITVPQVDGYLAVESVTSPDGRCRAFDADAHGTVGGDGAGIVVLKRLADALDDGDTIHAVIKGFATNNDGALKVGYTSPGVDGQSEVIALAQAVAGIDPATVTYVEAHGTGTPLGDPIEVAALTDAFAAKTDRKGFCALGSVKTNIGHLDAAAGVAGLLKTVLAVERGVLPPSLHFQRPNPRIDFAATPFYVNTELRPWRPGGPRRAGVSSFAIGGVNAHLVVEEAPEPEASGPALPWQLLLLSARSESALETATHRLARHLRDHPEQDLADVAYTLQVGRQSFPYRRMVVCRDREDAIACLEGRDPRRLLGNAGRPGEMADLPVAFLFPGLGDHHAGMARELYRWFPGFRERFDLCAERLQPLCGEDLRAVLYPPETATPESGDGGSGLDLRVLLGRAPRGEAGEPLGRTALSQPAVFVVEYALAALLMDWGIQPQAMLGFSVGELVAACLAGVLSLDDALRLVAGRARLVDELPPGAMLAVSLPEADVVPLLGDGLSLAAVGAPELCVVAGQPPAVERLEARLAASGVICRRLQTAHAFHSSMMEPAAGRLRALAATLELRAPEIPYVSNVTGTWMGSGQATDPAYWAEHLRRTVRFADGLAVLCREPGRVLLEVGPGQGLSAWARQHPDTGRAGALVLPTLPHPADRQSDLAVLLTALGRLWLAGVRIDGFAAADGQRRRRVPLPTYPFERQRYWIEARKTPDGVAAMPSPEAPLTKLADPAAWFYLPLWKQSPPLRPAPPELPAERQRWLVFEDSFGIGAALAERLAAAGGEVVTVREGEGFAGGDSAYTVDPGRREDYERLISDLLSLGRRPDAVVHLWSVPAPREEEAAGEPVFFPMLAFFQALERSVSGAAVDVTVVASGLWSVTGGEEVDPTRATLLGPCLVLPQESPGVSCRVIDLGAPAGAASASEIAAALLGEILKAGSERIVAYRHGRRWLRSFEAMPLEAMPLETPRAARTPVLREGAVVLITGGLGGAGLAFAERLARDLRAKLILTGRSPFPPPEEWDARLAASPNDELAHRIRLMQAIRRAGGEVLTIAADVTDEAAMRQAVAAARERFGRIDGVIHAAGVLPGGLIEVKDPAEAAAVLAPKVTGTLVLERVLRDDPPDVMLLCSSLTAIGGAFGLVDHCAANAFLDAFAQSRAGRPGTWVVSVDWDAWLEVGQAARTVQQLGMAGGLVQDEPAAHSHGSNDSHHPHHPLLGRRAAEGDREVFTAGLATATHWMLDEHRLLGDGLLPGTAYLEMLRAGFAARAGEAEPRIRDLVFANPLRVRDGEVKEVRAVFEEKEGSVHASIESLAGGGWERHAAAWLDPVAPLPAPRHDLQAIRARCAARDVTPAADDADLPVRFGRRWQGLLREMAVGDGEGIALLELDAQFADELATLPLHPALLDGATGLVQVLGEGGYLPLAYDEVHVRAALPRRVYSYFRLHEGGKGRETLTCDLVLTDEEGVERVAIRGYTLRRLDPAGLPGRVGEPPPAAASPAGIDAGGLLTREGTEVLMRVLAADVRTPQILVSTRDLPALLRQAETVTRSHVLGAAERLRSGAAVHPRPHLHVAFVAPRDETESGVALAVQTVLRLEEVGVHDSFFDLGGDSLTATSLVANLNEAFGVELSLRSVFEAPTVAELAQEVTRLLSAAGGQRRGPRLEKRSRSGPLPLSFAQQRLWFVEQLTPGTPAYNVPAAVSLSGRLDIRALAAGLDEIARRHEALRTSFSVAEGSPVQRIAPHVPRALPVIDLSGLEPETRQRESESLVGEEAARVFDLERGPLERRSLLRLDGTEHVLLVTLHHLVADQQSHALLVAELSQLYRAFTAGAASPLPEPEVQYADFAQWQRELVASGGLDEQLAYWRTALAAAPPSLELPTDRPRPPVQTFNGARRPVYLGRELTEALTQLGRAEGATLFMTLLAAFEVFLHLCSDQQDIIVGTPVSGRTRRETQGLIGLFANTLALRTGLSGAGGFQGVLRRVRETALGAFANQDVPFEKIVEELRIERDPSRQTLFQVLFVLQEATGPDDPFPGLQVRALEPDSGTAKVDVTAFLVHDAEGVSGWLIFNSDLFESTTMEWMTQDFHRLARLVVEHPGEPLETLRASLAQEHRHRRSRERERARKGHLQLLAELSRQAAATGAEGQP